MVESVGTLIVGVACLAFAGYFLITRVKEYKKIKAAVLIAYYLFCA